MKSPAPRSRRRTWVLLLGSAAALALLAVTAPALEPAQKSAGQIQESVRQPAKAFDTRKTLETSPMPVEWQLDQLRGRIQQLESQVAALQDQTQHHGAAGSNVAGRLAALEGAVQVASNKVRLQSPGAVEIKAAGTITVEAGTKVVLKGPYTDVTTPHLRVHGTAQSDRVLTDSVVSKSYTPGAGNVW